MRNIKKFAVEKKKTWRGKQKYAGVENRKSQPGGKKRRRKLNYASAKKKTFQFTKLPFHKFSDRLKLEYRRF